MITLDAGTAVTKGVGIVEGKVGEIEGTVAVTGTDVAGNELVGESVLGTSVVACGVGARVLG